MASADEVKRKTNRMAFISMIGAAVLIALNFLPTDPEPFLWIKMALMIAIVIVMVGWLTRFVLWQRAEYWRERGKDPKHPELPASRDNA
ncbi:hypothetical protein R5O87_22000 [Arthrobacter globiformis]